MKLEIVFYQNDYIFKYNTILKADPNLGSKGISQNSIFTEKYYKSKVKEIYVLDDGFEELIDLGELPEDTSIVFCFERKLPRAVYFNCEGEEWTLYRLDIQGTTTYKIISKIFARLQIFDDNIKSLVMVDEKHYKIAFQDDVRELSDSELVCAFSYGTNERAFFIFLWWQRWKRFRSSNRRSGKPFPQNSLLKI